MPVMSVKPALIFSGVAGRTAAEIVPERETRDLAGILLLTEGLLVVQQQPCRSPTATAAFSF